MIKDVEVIVTRETQAMSQEGFGMHLVLSTEGEQDYGEYTDISDVADDYDEETKAYKIASRVLGQSPRPSKIAMYGIDYGEVDSADDLVSALNDLVEKNN